MQQLLQQLWSTVRYFEQFLSNLILGYMYLHLEHVLSYLAVCEKLLDMQGRSRYGRSVALLCSKVHSNVHQSDTGVYGDS